MVRTVEFDNHSLLVALVLAHFVPPLVRALASLVGLTAMGSAEASGWPEHQSDLPECLFVVWVNIMESLGGWWANWPARQALELGRVLLCAQEATIQSGLWFDLNQSRSTLQTHVACASLCDGQIKS